MKSELYALTRYQEDDYSSQIRLFTTMDKAREEFIKTIRNLNAVSMNVPEDAERFDDERNFHECVDRLEYKNTHEDDGADWAVVFLLEPGGEGFELASIQRGDLLVYILVFKDDDGKI